MLFAAEGARVSAVAAKLDPTGQAQPGNVFSGEAAAKESLARAPALGPLSPKRHALKVRFNG